MFAQLQDLLRAIDISDNSTTNGTQQCENYLKKLSSLSRYVTPCPDILDDVGPSNNNPANPTYTSSDKSVQPSPGRIPICSTTRGHVNCQYPECDDSDSSDESAWESLQTPTPRRMSGQWRNLIEYEASLLANQAQQSMNIKPTVGQNNLSLTPAAQMPQVRCQASLQAEDVVEVLNSIARSLKKLGGHSCENATDMFGQYIAHRLSEMSDENRREAEIEINRVLMKYVSKDIQRGREGTPVQGACEEDNKNKHLSKKKEQNIV